MPTSNIDRAAILHVAELASLSLSDEEVDRFGGELRRILEYFETLDQLDTRDVPPTAHLELNRAPWRNDEPVPGLAHEDALSQAPRVEEGGFAVPTFVE